MSAVANVTPAAMETAMGTNHCASILFSRIRGASPPTVLMLVRKNRPEPPPGGHGQGLPKRHALFQVFVEAVDQDNGIIHHHACECHHTQKSRKGIRDGARRSDRGMAPMIPNGTVMRITRGWV